MAAVRQHPHHLPVPVLAQANRARRVVGYRLSSAVVVTVTVLREGKPRVGIYDGLVEADDGVLVVVVVFGYEDYAGEDYAVIFG